MRAKADNPDLAGIPQLPTPLRHDVQLYVQVYDVLYDMISGGQLKPGDLIPGECALAQHFGVSRGTVRQAIQYREDEAVALAQRLIPATWLERCSVDPNSVEEMRAFAIDQVPKLVTDSRAEITIHTEVIPEISRSGEIPCFSISEIASDGEGRPVGHFKNYLRSDCYRLYLERHRGPR